MVRRIPKTMTKGHRLLIVTQAVDLDSPVLGFFHRWIEEIATHFESVVVICLFEGRHSLPQNVEVFSLGKEKREAYKPEYAQRFLALVWGLRGRYDSVFVHMNLEYVLLAGWLWMLLRKPVYLWRNHYQRSPFMGFAAFFCKKMFCTSEYSYNAKYKKTVLMPLGIDTDTFKPLDLPRLQSVLSIGRIAPSKQLEILIDAIALLAKDNIKLGTHIYGEALPQDMKYLADLKKRAQGARIEHLIEFHPGVRNSDTPALYSAHEIFVNCSRSGMYDKTIFEALACGALSIASSGDYADVADKRLTFDGTPESLADTLKIMLKLSAEERANIRNESRGLVEKNSVRALGRRLAEEVQ